MRGMKIYILLAGLTSILLNWGHFENAIAKDSQTAPVRKVSPEQMYPFQSAKFFEEPQQDQPEAQADQKIQAHPSAEGKVVVKDSQGNYLPLKRPQPPSSSDDVTRKDLSPLGGPDIFVDFGSETSVALNYDDPNNLVGLYNYFASLANSADGNLSWTLRTFPTGIFTEFPYDPWAFAGNDSAEFFGTLIRYGPNFSHCIIGRSTDAGDSFSLFYERNRPVYQDREMVDVDRTTLRGGGLGSTHDGKVYLCYDDFGEFFTSYSGSYLQIISPTGTGLTENQTSGITDRGYQMQPVAGITDGTVYLKAKRLSYNGARIHEITNGGAGPNTFNKSVLTWTDVGQHLGTSGRPGVNGHRVDINGYLDIDRSFGPKRGFLYLISNRNLHTSDTTLDQGEVYISVSNNGASSWSSAAIPTQAGKTQYFPMLDVDEQGWLHVAYYQNDTGTVDGGVLNATTANLYYTFSFDGGANWSAPVMVNDSANSLDYDDPPLNLADHYYLIGDYAQIKVAETDSTKKAYLLWSQYDKDEFFSRVLCTTVEYNKCFAKPGDANASQDYSLPDVIAIVNYIFSKPGCSPLPTCWLTNLNCRGDWDGSTTVSLSDVIRAVNFIFNKPNGPWNALPSGACCL